MVTEADIMESLKKAIDPETGMSMVDMGLIKEVHIEGSTVKIKMALTSPFCPLAGYLAEEVRRKAQYVEGIEKVEVEII